MSISQSVSNLSSFRTQPCLVNIWGPKLMKPFFSLFDIFLIIFCFFFHHSVHSFILFHQPDPSRKGQVPAFNYKFKSKTNLPTQIMSNATEALGEFFVSLPPSPEWAPFWASLFEGALSALSVWFFALLGFTNAYCMQLICSLLMYFAFFLIVVRFAYQDGWRKVDITECLGRIFVVSGFGRFSHKYFYGDER